MYIRFRHLVQCIRNCTFAVPRFWYIEIYLQTTSIWFANDSVFGACFIAARLITRKPTTTTRKSVCVLLKGMSHCWFIKQKAHYFLVDQLQKHSTSFQKTWPNYFLFTSSQRLFHRTQCDPFWAMHIHNHFNRLTDIFQWVSQTSSSLEHPSCYSQIHGWIWDTGSVLERIRQIVSSSLSLEYFRNAVHEIYDVLTMKHHELQLPSAWTQKRRWSSSHHGMRPRMRSYHGAWRTAWGVQ